MKSLVFCPNGERVTRSEKAVGMVLADSHQDRGTSFTYPALDTIAEESASDRRTTQRLLASLERKGVIVRLRPKNQGRGSTVFYFFTALDAIPEGWHNAALFSGDLFLKKGGRRAAEGRRKGGNSDIGLIVRAWEPEQVQQKQQELYPPTPLQAGGDVDFNKTSAVHNPGEGGAIVNTPEAHTAGVGNPLDRGVDQVMQGCGFVRRRLRGVICAVLKQRSDVGEFPATTALAMMAAWKEYILLGDLLAYRCGPDKFFGDGLWNKPDAWLLDKAAVERQRLQAQARGGTYRAPT